MPSRQLLMNYAELIVLAARQTPQHRRFEPSSLSSTVL
jgi:hypothetical protein